jgi:simple sugar transport system ATP-binding protein
MSAAEALPAEDPFADAPVVLEARHVTKRFPGVVANDDVSIQVRRGEIVGLLGENGAGKSTLVKMLYGVYNPDEGEICIKGESLKMKSPRDAIQRGVGMVFQHFQLVGVFTVAENVTLGDEPSKARLFDKREAERRVGELSDQFGLAVDPKALVEDLPVGTQQRVEIIKALYRKADILILDEPTAVLTPGETDELLKVMRDLASQGVAIVFITHKLREVMAVCDSIFVLRAGRVTGHTRPAETDTAGLARMMVGRDVVLQVEKDPARPADVVLDVQDIEVVDHRGHRAVRGVSLQVHAGEILGVAGVEGNGQRELVEALCGMRPIKAGRVTIDGKDTTHWKPRQINRAGVAHIPEDRERHGFVAAFSVADNLVLERFDEPPFARGIVRNFGAVRERAKTLVERFDVRPRNIDNPVSALSGGNKQKVIVARELSQDARLLVAAQPTRGIDVGSIEFIHRQLIEQRDAGKAVLLVSAELDEILSLSDRVAVIYEGEIQAVLPVAEASRERLGLLMTGAGDPGPPSAATASADALS